MEPNSTFWYTETPKTPNNFLFIKINVFGSSRSPRPILRFAQDWLPTGAGCLESTKRKRGNPCPLFPA
jgi:hypothetical protein